MWPGSQVRAYRGSECMKLETTLHDVPLETFCFPSAEPSVEAEGSWACLMGTSCPCFTRDDLWGRREGGGGFVGFGFCSNKGKQSLIWRDETP